MKYLPFLKGKYTVNPGLKAIDKANGYDRKIFQFDEHVRAFLENKNKCRKEGISKYYCEQDLDPQTRNAINAFIIEQLQREYPNFFYVDKTNKEFICTLTGDAIVFSDNGEADYPDKYVNLFDALCSQVQEDLAIFKFTRSTDWLSAVHLCAPNHWSPSEKIGLNFDLIHDPIPGLEKMRKHYYPMLRSVIDKGPFYRYGWGIGTDNRLNHHPNAPLGFDQSEWNGRRFDPENPKLYIRVERQTLTGFHDQEAILFTIRTYFYEVNVLEKVEKDALISAIESMSEASLVYKGLSKDRDSILSYLHV